MAAFFMSPSKHSTVPGSVRLMYRPSPTLISKTADVLSARRFFETVATSVPSSCVSTGEPFLELKRVMKQWRRENHEYMYVYSKHKYNNSTLLTKWLLLERRYETEWLVLFHMQTWWVPVFPSLCCCPWVAYVSFQRYQCDL